MGVWHWFSIKHGDRYLSELAARWNLLGMTNMERFDTVITGIFRPALPWKELTA